MPSQDADGPASSAIDDSDRMGRLKSDFMTADDTACDGASFGDCVPIHDERVPIAVMLHGRTRRRSLTQQCVATSK